MLMTADDLEQVPEIHLVFPRGLHLMTFFACVPGAKKALALAALTVGVNHPGTASTDHFGTAGVAHLTSCVGVGYPVGALENPP